VQRELLHQLAIAREDARVVHADAVEQKRPQILAEAHVEQHARHPRLDLRALLLRHEARAAPQQARPLEALLAGEAEDDGRHLALGAQLLDQLDEVLLAPLVE
jgi:hypothetical protein